MESISAEKPPSAKARMKVCSALAALDQQKYRKVAMFLSEIDFTLALQLNDIASLNDIALYGGLCALATFDRSDLKKLLDNSHFRQFLELEPHVREIMISFYESRYKTCLNLLETHKNDLLLDLYLHSHVEQLYTNIRKRALVQYFKPFSFVNMHKMADAFGCQIQDFETEIMHLISSGFLPARIDSHNKILCCKNTDERSRTFQQTMKNGDRFCLNSNQILLKLDMLQNDLIVHSPKDEGSGLMDHSAGFDTN
jgi:COP9 signalosome complex subunit 1